MVKNFFDYTKELIPEKGSVFFTHENHVCKNSLSLYDVVNILHGQKVEKIDEVTAYSWNVERIWDYPFPIMGLMLLFSDGKERWMHFSKHAFIGAVCIMAIENEIEFEQPEFEEVRQAWIRKLNNQSLEEDKVYTDLSDKESNFDDILYISREEVRRRDLHYRNYERMPEWEFIDNEHN